MTRGGAERRFDRSKIIRYLPPPIGQAHALAPAAKALKPRQRRMFQKLRGPRFMRLSVTPDEMHVGFSGRASTIGWQHQLGADERPQRELIGLSDEDVNLILDEAYRLIDEAMA